jgi:hypothetical protein
MVSTDCLLGSNTGFFLRRSAWLDGANEYDEKDALINLLKPTSPFFRLLITYHDQRHLSHEFPLQSLPVRMVVA